MWGIPVPPEPQEALEPCIQYIGLSSLPEIVGSLRAKGIAYKPKWSRVYIYVYMSYIYILFMSYICTCFVIIYIYVAFVAITMFFLR